MLLGAAKLMTRDDIETLAAAGMVGFFCGSFTWVILRLLYLLFC